MESVDMIYIINKKEHFLNRDKCLAQLAQTGITKYMFMDAIYPSAHYTTKIAYEHIIKFMDPQFVKNNFSIGALGCLLSHIQVAKHAMRQNYKQIIVLEGDFIISKNFFVYFPHKIASLRNNWDFIYLGKKQGNSGKFDEIDSIHNTSKYFKDPVPINPHFHSANYQTWGTHAIMYKNSIFKKIVNFETEIIAPIDIMLMSLYNKHTFCVAQHDLLIADESSSDIDSSKINHVWGWDVKEYLKVTTTKIKHLVVIGYKASDHHTHHYIHKMYFHFFAHYYPNLNVIWGETFEEVGNSIHPNECLIFTSPCHTSKRVDLPKGAFYIIHLDSIDNEPQKECELNKFFDGYKEIQKSNRYIVLTCRKGLYDLTYFQSCPKNRAICLPWFADNLYKEIYAIKKNIGKYYKMHMSKSYFCYFGSIWNLNVDIILELIKVFAKNGEKLLLKGRMFGLDKEKREYIMKINLVHKNIQFELFNYKEREDYTNTFEYIDSTYGIKALLPLQGREHNETYMSNRLFETLSRGYLAITNCKIAKDTFNTVLYNEKISDLIANYVDVLKTKEKWYELMNKQIDEYLWKFYGYNNIKTLFGFLRKTCEKHLQLPYFDEVNNSNYILWIRSRRSTTPNKYFQQINNDTDIQTCLQNCDHNYILNWDIDMYDAFLVDRLLSNPHFSIWIDATAELQSCKCLQKLLNGREYTFKKKLEIYCLISGQRTGSTILIDILQKLAPNVLALSEIFWDYDTSYDVTKGVLKDQLIDFLPLNLRNEEEYVQQFIDYAEYKNFEKFVFKLTIDFTQGIQSCPMLHKFLNVVCNYNIIYLRRNDVMSYVSKKLSELHGYANVCYDTIPNNLFSISELNRMIDNKIDFEKEILDVCLKSKIINYKEGCTNTDLIKICEDSFDININENDILCKKYVELNIKQNKFTKDQLFDKNYWV